LSSALYFPAQGLMRALHLVVVCLLCGSAGVGAQTSSGLDLQRYRPSPGVNDVLSTSSARTGGHLRWQLGASVDYAHRPLSLYNLRTGQTVEDAVSSQTSVNVMGALGLTRVLELGLAVPVVIQPQSNANTGTPPQSSGFGDIRFTPKVRLWANDNVALGLAATLLIPSGGVDSFRGAGGLGLLPRFLF
jgi:hypothetical protein